MRAKLVMAGLTLAALLVVGVGCDEDEHHHDHHAYNNHHGYWDRDERHHDWDARPAGGRVYPYHRDWDHDWDHR